MGRAAASDTAFNLLNEQAKQVRSCINDGDATRARSLLDDLSMRAAEATSETLSAYDARVLQETLASLDLDISSSLKRPKFSFRNKTKKDKKVVAPIEIEIAPPPSKAAQTNNNKNTSQEDVEETTGKHLVLKGPRHALRMRALQRCIVVVEDDICGSTLIRECKNCIFVLTARQIRIHDCTHCTFLVGAATGPIIENCRALIFGPGDGKMHTFAAEMQMVAMTITIEKDGEIAGKVEVNPDAWKDVKDFNWLRPGESPNYRLIRDDDVISDALQWKE